MTAMLAEAPKPITFLRRPEVERRVGLATSTLYYEIQQGRFPKPIKLTGGRVGWLESDVAEWQAARLAASGWGGGNA